MHHFAERQFADLKKLIFIKILTNVVV
jgi:hypothetical protein